MNSDNSSDNETDMGSNNTDSNTASDEDNDGVMDDIDICQGTIAGSVVDSLGCSSSQRDSDSDGVTDNFDQCPNTPANTIIDTTGCSVQPSSGTNSTEETLAELEDEGMPGFEAKVLFLSIILAIYVARRKM